MPRNRSEKLPHEDPEVDPDFYKLLRIYATCHAERKTPSEEVRLAKVRWGLDHTDEVYALFGPWGANKKTDWYDWPTLVKRAYVADYMDYLYGTQSK